MWGEQRILCYNENMTIEKPQDSNGIPVTEAELIIMERQAIGLLKKIWAIRNVNRVIADLDKDLWIQGARTPK